MKDKEVSRRLFCKSAFTNGLLFFGAGAFAAACGGGNSRHPPTETPKEPAGDPCTDFSGVAAGELEKRQALGYVEKTPIPDNTCENCKLFVPGNTADIGCGGCMLFKGPVLSGAYCTYWAPQDE